MSNLATLNPYACSIYKHLRLSYQKYYAKGKLEKCRPLYSKHGLSFQPGQAICSVQLSIYTRIKAVKQHFFPATDDSGYVPSSRKVCLHFSLFNIFLSNWSWKSEVWSRKSEVGSRKLEVGSLKCEVWSRKSEVGSRKSLLGFCTRSIFKTDNLPKTWKISRLPKFWQTKKSEF